MLGATVLELYKKWSLLSMSDVSTIGIGFVVSFIVAYGVVKTFIAFLSRYGLKPFGWYRIILGLAGVQAESHYGIVPLPPPDTGGGGTDATPPTPGTPDVPGAPGEEISIPGTPGTPAHQAGTLGYHLAGSVGTPPHTKHKKPGLLSQLLHGLFHPFEGLKNFWALIISHPVEAVMVFLMLAVLAIPVYLAIRRRELTRALMSEA